MLFSSSIEAKIFGGAEPEFNRCHLDTREGVERNTGGEHLRGEISPSVATTPPLPYPCRVESVQSPSSCAQMVCPFSAALGQVKER